MSDSNNKISVSIPSQIKELLSSQLLKNRGKIDQFYLWVEQYFQNQFFESTDFTVNAPLFDIQDLTGCYSSELNSDVRNLGIDFPVLLSKAGNRSTLMICAMDPLRADIEDDSKSISPWVPFSIVNNPIQETKYSEKENLVFFQVLLEEYNLYVTDIFKLFYRNGEIKSNSLKNFISLSIHREILEKEIERIQPDIIITLGNNARSAIATIFPVQCQEWSDTIHEVQKVNGQSILMIPHISQSANGTKSPILNNSNYSDIAGSGNEKYAKIVIQQIKDKSKMDISGNYRTPHGEMQLSTNGDIVTGSYAAKGAIKGELKGNILSGEWSNNGSIGLFEWEFGQDGNFKGKFKKGLEQGVLKGKWSGTRISGEEELSPREIKDRDSASAYLDYLKHKTSNNEKMSNASVEELLEDYSWEFDEEYFGDLKEHVDILVFSIDNSEDSIEEHDGADKISVCYDLRNNCIYMQTENNDEDIYRYLLTYDARIPENYEEHSEFWGCYSVTNLNGDWGAFFQGNSLEYFDGELNDTLKVKLKNCISSKTMFRFLEDVLYMF
jgi:hypothetical protein